MNIPKSISENVLNVFGIDIKVHVLDDGRRIIEEQSFLDLLNRMSQPDCPKLTEREAKVLAAFCSRGLES